MINIDYFRANVEPKLKGYVIKYSFHPNGDFGDLERVEIEGENKIGGIDFWSMGWLDIDVYDLILDEQVMNKLLDPSEVEAQQEAICEFLRILSSDE